MADTAETPAPKKSGNKTLLIVVVILVVLLAVGGLVAKKLSEQASKMVGTKLAEKMIETAAGGKADVDIKDDGLTVRTNEGSFSVGTELPADFPKDIPLYPGAKVTYSGTNSSDNGGGVGATFSTADDYTQVAAFYTRELPANGWTVDSTQNIAGTTVMSAKKDTRTLAVTATTSDGQTAISLGMNTESQ